MNSGGSRYAWPFKASGGFQPFTRYSTTPVMLPNLRRRRWILVPSLATEKLSVAVSRKCSSRH